MGDPTTTHLGTAIVEEFIGVNAVTDSATEEWEPVEDDRRFMRVLEQELTQDIDHYRQDSEGQCAHDNQCVDGL